MTAVLDIGTLQALLTLQWSTLSAVSFAFVLALVCNYLLHQRITFRSRLTTTSFLRFLVVVGLNYLLTLACVWLGVQLAGSVLIGKLASLPLVTLSGFLFGKYWIFVQQPTDTTPQ